MVTDRNHRKQVRHFHELGDFHEFTFSCYRRMPLLTNDDWRQRFSRCLDDALGEMAFQLVAFVYMPEHVHLLVYPPTPEPDIGRFLARMLTPPTQQFPGLPHIHGVPLGAFDRGQPR
jgi:putative transposase